MRKKEFVRFQLTERIEDTFASTVRIKDIPMLNLRSSRELLKTEEVILTDYSINIRHSKCDGGFVLNIKAYGTEIGSVTGSAGTGAVVERLEDNKIKAFEATHKELRNINLKAYIDTILVSMEAVLMGA